MNVTEAIKLPFGTRVRAKFLFDNTEGRFTMGTVITSFKYGPGIRFDGYPYNSNIDMHSFFNMGREMLDTLEVVNASSNND